MVQAFWFTAIVTFLCRIPLVHRGIRRCQGNGAPTTSTLSPSLAPTVPISPSPVPSKTGGNDDDKQERPMNILILFGDDWRYNSLGMMNPIVQTPTLDALARNGVHFVNSYVTTSVCWVSRATYFTGQYMSRHQTTRVVDPKFYTRWNTTSWPALLQQSPAQYYVGHIGKWQFSNPNQFVQSVFNFTSLFEYHVNRQTGIRGTEHTVNETKRFFDEYTRWNQMNVSNDARTKRPFALTLAMFPPKSEMDSTIPSQNYVTRDLEYNLYKNVPIPIVTNNINDTSFRKLPYFLQSTSPPTESRRRYEQKYIPNASYQENMQRYYALITEVDSAFRQIIQELQARNLYNDTVIIFTTDNGYMHGEHGLSGKWYPFQESIRVPLIIADPRMPLERRNTKDQRFVLNIDLAPTILSIGNVTTSNNSNNVTTNSSSNLLPSEQLRLQQQQMQGMDITQLYLPRNNSNNNTSNTTVVPWRNNELYYEHPTIQSRNYLTASTALITLQYSYMIYPEWDNYEVLYDLQRDPLEQTNVANDTNYRAIVQYYRDRHAEMRETVK